jgi:hypothetical protein
MSAIDRQNRLLVAEDWQKIYRSFRNADFQSYDFENLRRTMIDYIRTNYPEDFNDYVESSEYLALIDLIAFLGQSIAFRVDLNARENFLELAERRESILRLARLISYNAKRNTAAQGLLKFSTIQTTQNVLDSNGRNLSGQSVTWNDPSNPNWYDQFIKILNVAMPSIQQFGNPADKSTIYGIPTEQYRFNTSNSDVPVFGFTKSVAGRSMNFEITSTTFSGQNYIYEEPPKIGNRLACVYRDDGRGASSPGTGFFLNFTQGTLNQGTFTITQPSTSESVDIDSQSINNTDVWLYKLDQNGLESSFWTKVSSMEGNNIIYNSLNKNIRDIYGVTTRVNDAISLTFSDGTFGNVPLGTFRVYYRISNGLAYTINTQDIRSVNITIPYISNQGQSENLSITLNLATSVSNASTAESNDSIKTNAPQTYYTQNRMVTGEDYNISPLSSNLSVAKVKAVNRSSSGISRYFDLIDPTGKYSSTNLFADDGVLYVDNFTSELTFSFSNKTDIEGVINNKIFEVIKRETVKNFYYSQFVSYLTTSLNIQWVNVTSDSTSSTGYIADVVDNTIYKVSSFTATDLKYFSVGALIRFAAPTGYYFDTTNNNKLTLGTASVNGATSYIWTEVSSVTNDGTASGTGVLSTGYGPIILNQNIPSNAIVSQIIPKWRTTIDSSVISVMVELIFTNKPFGLRYEPVSQSWQIIFESNLNQLSNFSLGKEGDASNKNQDSSWFLLFTTNNEYYTVTSRETRYIFESDQQIKFYFDNNSKIYDSKSNKVVNDLIKVLSINTRPDSTSPFTLDNTWSVISSFNGLDGYVDNTKVIVGFADSDSNGVVDNPELFLNIVAPTTNSSKKYIIQQKYSISTGQEDYQFVSNDKNVVIIKPTDSSNAIGSLVQYVDGQYFYFEDTKVVKKLNSSTSKLIPTLDYKVYVGRDKLKFQYIHSANYESRIDPGSSNIIDIFVLTKGYDTQFRQWLAGAAISKPLPPSSDELYNTLSPNLNLIKSISDEIIYHPVAYQILFGSSADLELQASFKITKTPGSVVSDNDIKTRVITAINQFFSLDNWDFGDTFYFTELATYVMNQLAPDVANFVIVPTYAGLNFGSLFEIKSASDKIFINGATVDNIDIISGITSSNIKSVSGTATQTIVTSQTPTSSIYGASNG